MTRRTAAGVRADALLELAAMVHGGLVRRPAAIAIGLGIVPGIDPDAIYGRLLSLGVAVHDARRTAGQVRGTREVQARVTALGLVEASDARTAGVPAGAR
jgi:hypothetical protein